MQSEIFMELCIRARIYSEFLIKIQQGQNLCGFR